MRVLLVLMLSISILAVIGCSNNASDDTAEPTAAADQASIEETAAPTEIVGETSEATEMPTEVVAATEVASADDSMVEFDEALYQRGIQVYRQNYCGTCHELDAAETWGNFGPSHNASGLVAQRYIDNGDYTGPATNAEEYLYEAIVDPMSFMTPGYQGGAHPMPAFVHLPEEDLDALVYLLVNQRGTE